MTKKGEELTNESCPYCNSSHVDARGGVNEFGQAEMSMRCLECGKIFSESVC